MYLTLSSVMMNNLSALNTINLQKGSCNKAIIKYTPREGDNMFGSNLSIGPCTHEGGQGFCWVDSEGVVKGYFGYDFLLGILEHEGISIEEFCKYKGWERLGEEV